MDAIIVINYASHWEAAYCIEWPNNNCKYSTVIGSQ